MSDYELADLFMGYTGALQSSFMNFVAVLFAFLIAGHLVAGKLQSGMVAIVVGPFTILTLQQSITVLGYGHDVAGLADQIWTQAAENPTSLGWHGTATPVLSSLVPILQFSAIVVGMLSYIGALVFFFNQRRVGRAEQTTKNLRGAKASLEELV